MRKSLKNDEKVIRKSWQSHEKVMFLFIQKLNAVKIQETNRFGI